MAIPPVPPPPPPPGRPQQPATQKTSEVIGTFRSSKLFKLSKPDATVTSLDFDDSGEYLLAACSDDSLQLYSAKEGKHVKELLSQKYGAHLARFTHHATSIIYASTKVDDGIRYLSTHDNAFLRYFKGHTKPVTAIAVCPGADTFLSCSKDDTIRLWDLKSPSPQGRLNLLTPHLAAYDPSATVIAIASSATQTILLYDLRNYDKPPFATFDVRPYSPSSSPAEWSKIEFSNDGKSLLLGTTSSQAGHLLLDAFDGSLRAHCMVPTTLSNTSTSTTSSQGDVCFTSDGRYLLSSSASSSSSSSTSSDILVFDTQAREPETKQLRPFCSLPGASTGAAVGMKGGKGQVIGWNPRYNMFATAGSGVGMWVPDEHVSTRPV